MLKPDLDQIEQFTDATFRHCSRGFVSLRVFASDGKLVHRRGVRVDGRNLHRLNEEAVRAALQVLEPAINTADATGKMVLTGAGHGGGNGAWFELGFIKERQRAGIEAAKAKGIYKGRPAGPRAHQGTSRGWSWRHRDREAGRVLPPRRLQDDRWFVARSDLRARRPLTGRPHVGAGRPARKAEDHK